MPKASNEIPEKSPDQTLTAKNPMPILYNRNALQ